MAYVYRHIRTDKDQPFYIGVGLRDNGYKRAHQSSKDKRSTLWHNIAKNGYEIEILLDGLTDSEAFAKEIEFIALYGRIDKGTGTLCNHTDGGESPTPLYGDDNPARRPEVRRKLSIMAKERMAKGVSEETRRRMSASLKGRAPTKPRQPEKRLHQKSLDGALVYAWASVKEAAECGMGWKMATLYGAAREGGQLTAYGYKWSYSL